MRPRYFICETHSPPTDLVNHLESLSNVPLVNGEKFDDKNTHHKDLRWPDITIQEFLDENPNTIFVVQEFISNQLIDLLDQYPDTKLITNSLIYSENYQKSCTDHLGDRVHYYPWWSNSRGFFDDSFWQDSYKEKSHCFDLLMFKEGQSRAWLFENIRGTSFENSVIMTYHSEYPEYSAQWKHLDYFDIQSVKMTSENLNGKPASSQIPVGFYENSHHSIVSETVTNQNKFVVTEKTGKVLTSGRLALWAGSWGFVDHLRGLGFDVFDDIVDHTYDQQRHSEDRLSQMLESAQNLAKESPHKLWEHTYQRRLENRKLAQHYHYSQKAEAERLYKLWLS